MVQFVETFFVSVYIQCNYEITIVTAFHFEWRVAQKIMRSG